MTEIIATAGASDANAYCTVADADAFLLGERLLGSAWDSVPDKPAALIMATQQIDRMTFIGVRASTTQALAWPRSSATLADGRTLIDTAIPVAVVRATCEMAFWLSQGNRTAPPGGQTLESLTVGPIELTFRNASDSVLAQMPDIVRGHLLPLLATQSVGGPFHKVARA